MNCMHETVDFIARALLRHGDHHVIGQCGVVRSKIESTNHPRLAEVLD